MKLEEWKKFAPLIQEVVDGKTLQIKIDGNWMDFKPEENIKFDSGFERYRIKPEKKWREWKIEEVPVGALIRGGEIFGISMIVSSRNGCVHYMNGSVFRSSDPECFLKHNEYSIDFGKTWQKCGVEE